MREEQRRPVLLRVHVIEAGLADEQVVLDRWIAGAFGEQCLFGGQVRVRAEVFLLVQADQRELGAVARPPGDRRQQDVLVVGLALRDQLAVFGHADDAAGELFAQRPGDVRLHRQEIEVAGLQADLAAEFELRALAHGIDEAT